MKRYLNLMTDRARFRVALRVQLRRWALAFAACAIALAPPVVIRWQQHSRVRQEHEALQASYEPVRRLSDLNRQLRTDAMGLVRDERLALELANRRPVTAILGRISEAAAEAGGQVYVERLHYSQSPPGSAEAAHDQLTIDLAAVLSYDVSQFVERLHQAPLTSVKVVSDLVITQNGVDQKNYTLECQF